MKFFRFAPTFLFLLIFSKQVFPQPDTASDDVKYNAALAVDKDRAARLKTDFLQGIQSLGNDQKAKFYAGLGDTLWKYDEKEASIWLNKILIYNCKMEAILCYKLSAFSVFPQTL